MEHYDTKIEITALLAITSRPAYSITSDWFGVNFIENITESEELRKDSFLLTKMITSKTPDIRKNIYNTCTDLVKWQCSHNNWW